MSTQSNTNSLKDNTPIGLFTKQHAKIGKITAWSTSILIIIYFITLILGLLSLSSPQDPIGNPYFTILELIILLLAPLMVITMVVVHLYASNEKKLYSLTALVFISIMACITSGLHFVVLTISRYQEFTSLVWTPLFFSFNWPSVVYTLDILAWDIFYSLSMLFAAAVFAEKGLERIIRIFLITSGVLSLIGIIGIPLNNMQVRNIGIIGYTVFAIIVFFLFGLAFNRKVRK